MIKVLVIHGPNLNMLGVREPEIYGQDSFNELNDKIMNLAKQLQIELRLHHSNYEGKIVDHIQEALSWADGILINAGALSHTSYSIRDALAAVRLPTIEVHVTNIYARDEWRQRSVIAPVVTGVIVGLGTNGYLLALEGLKTIIEASRR